jgi:hypothetical protein
MREFPHVPVPDSSTRGIPPDLQCRMIMWKTSAVMPTEAIPLNLLSKIEIYIGQKRIDFFPNR